MRRLLTIALVSLILPIGWDTLALGQAHYQGCHITTQTPTVCMVGRGTFYAVTINRKGSDGTYAYFWDTATLNLSAVPIINLDTQTAGPPVTVIYNMQMTNGLTVWNAAGTVADITVLTE